MKGFTHRGDFASGQKPAGIPEVGLENIVSIVDQAFPKRVKAAESFSTGDQNINLSREARRAFKIVSRKRLFQPIDADLLKCLRRRESGSVIPNRTGYMGRAVHHYFKTRAAGGEYAGAGLDVIHEVRPEDAHLKCMEACILEAPGIHCLVLDGHLRLIHIAAPNGRDIHRDSSFRAAQQPVHRLACDLADGIPHGFFDPAPVEQSSLEVLFDREKVCPYQGVAYLLKVARSAPRRDASTTSGPAKRITAHTGFGHHASYGDTAHNARFKLGGSRGDFDVECLDVFNADRLYLRRQGFHRSQQSSYYPCGQ